MAIHSLGYTQFMYTSPTSVGAVSSETIFQQATNSQIEDLKAQLESLKMGSLSTSGIQQVAAVQLFQPSQPQVVAAHCENCGMFGHLPYMCQGTVEQVAAFQSYRQGVAYNNYNHPLIPTPTPYLPPHKNPASYIPPPPSKTTNLSNIQDL